jgi:uncharacterized protein (TIGR02246 family)
MLWLVAAPAVLLAAACAPKADTAADEAAIKKINDNVVRWFQNKNADSVASVYADDAVDMGPNAPPARGRAAILAEYTQFFAAPGFKGTVQPKGVMVSGDLAVTDGSYTLSMTGPGGAPMDDSGNYVVVLKKTNGNWMVTEGINTSERPLPAPPAAPAKKKGM